MRTLDRIPFLDPRNREYGIRSLMTAPPARVKKTWRYPDVRINQGSEGHCVGFGWSNELAGDPVRIGNVDDSFAHGMFRAAQAIDLEEGRNFTDGATVLAGAKAVQRLGYMEEYRWAFGIDDVLSALISQGPVVLGIDWLDGMYETRPSGLVDVSGSVVGGHCITLFGYNPGIRLWKEGFGLKKFEVVAWVNSWGPTYGKRGIGYVKVEDLEKLLAQQGEACVPIHRMRPQKGNPS